MENLGVASGVNYKEYFSDYGIQCDRLGIILDFIDRWLISCVFKNIFGEEGTEISVEYYLSEHIYKSRILNERRLKLRASK